ncbi:class F sortase [Streptomyces sp. NPDC001381]|uniref:class F sortase n=1 Tax=Streptomyces sp. NPDC001381 TaxID=3364567 RepID=UPI00369DE5F3
MNWLSSRSALLIGLTVALCGLAASVVLVVRAGSAGVRADAEDFGTEPVTSAAPGAPAAASPAPTGPTASGAAPAPAGAGEYGSPATPVSLPAPTRLSLPRLDLRAAVDPVGVTDDGRVAIPEDPRRVGWYRYSPQPGAPAGSSVIVGHVDSDDRGLGVLVALNDVRQGDRVTVERADGSRVDYRVVSRRTVAKQALAASGAFRTDGPAALTLITCTGPYLPDDGGYQNNLVVTAVEAAK